MQIKLEEAQQLLWDEDVWFNNDGPDSPENIKYKCIKQGDWVHQHKFQECYVIFEDASNNKFYRFTCQRQGSDFTDWYYYWDNQEFIDCEEVKKIEKIIKKIVWEKV